MNPYLRDDKSFFGKCFVNGGSLRLEWPSGQIPEESIFARQ